MATDALCLGVNLDGTLTIAPSRTSPSSPGQSGGSSFALAPRADNLAPANDKSQGRRTLTSGTYVELFSFANDNLRAWFVFLRVHSGTATVRVTYATTGQVVMPCSGLLVLEPPKSPAEEITALEIQGTSLVFEWAAFGADT